MIDARGTLAELNALLRLKTTVTAMKLFETVEAMRAVPRIRMSGPIESNTWFRFTGCC